MDIINYKNCIDFSFQDIIINKQIGDNLIKSAINIIKKLKEKYIELLKNINNTSSYLGIDSFNFQNKLLDMQLEHFKRMFNIIINRLYCDYYKIYKSIKNLVETNYKDIPIIESNFTVYKDLDIDKVFNFKEIIQLQNVIHQYIKNMIDILLNKNIEIQQFISNNNKGYNVNYYINEENTNITIYSERINLFLKYLNSCNTYHNKYLLDFIDQIQFFISNINKDISFDEFNRNITPDKFIQIIINKNNEEVNTIVESVISVEEAAIEEVETYPEQEPEQIQNLEPISNPDPITEEQEPKASQQL